MSNTSTIVLVGGPGTGKTELCKRLIANFGEDSVYIAFGEAECEHSSKWFKKPITVATFQCAGAAVNAFLDGAPSKNRFVFHTDGCSSDSVYTGIILCLSQHEGPKPAEPKAVERINHPPHYTAHPSGVECITITRHMGFNLGNAFKYIWRADLKGDAIEDLRKAVWYINDEIAKREAAK